MAKPKDRPKEWKVFNDPVHGHVKLHPLLIEIIDTPQFQRLRNIKQLGGVCYVYPGASHSRFEHSIGTAHLAGKLLRTLQASTTKPKIDNRDVLCVEIAALCHDLGHGPFSHLFDDKFIPMVLEKKQNMMRDLEENKTKNEEQKKEMEKLQEDIIRLKSWKHEKGSWEMFEHLVKCNKLGRQLRKEGLKLHLINYLHQEENKDGVEDRDEEEKADKDMTFIRELMNPEKEEEKEKGKEKEWPHKGRGVEKSFLYEIVSNKINGIDVDKFDYLARDCYHLGFDSSFDHKRFLEFVRVCEVDGRNHICVRDKMEDNIYDLFHMRYQIHTRACYHRVSNIIQHMIAEAFLEADENFKVEGDGGRMFSLSGAIADMEAYTKLTDTVFDQILHSSDEKLRGAREILERILRRDIYRFVGEKHLKKRKEDQKCCCRKETGKEEDDTELEGHQWLEAGSQGEGETGAAQKVDKEDIKKKLVDADTGKKLKTEDLVVEVIKINYGMKEKDPVKYVYFYSKNKPDTAEPMEESQASKIRTTCFFENKFRVYCKNSAKAKAAKESFGQLYGPKSQKDNGATSQENKGKKRKLNSDMDD